MRKPGYINAQRCNVEGCEQPRHAHGWCIKHLRRWEAHGDVTRSWPTLEERLQNYRVLDNGCWEWTGTRQTISSNNPFQKIPYGRVTVPRQGQRYAHRMMYQQANGVTLTRDQVVCHTCDYPLCVNPAHLLLGTQADNLAEMRVRGRGTPPPNRWRKTS